MKKIVLSLLLLLPALATAYTLEVARGITVYTINGEKVDASSSEPYQLLAGKNQIALRFEGKLREQGKKEHFQSKPYLLTLTAEDDVQLTTVSNKYKTLLSLAKQESAIFKIQAGAVELEQKVLPAIAKTLPYANIANLVSHYNEKNGIYFVDTGVEQLSAAQLHKQQAAKQSRVLAQLKYWYSQATAEEIAVFEKWQAAQSSK